MGARDYGTIDCVARSGTDLAVFDKHGCDCRKLTVMSKSPTSEFTSSAGVVMHRVPAGSFTMGSPLSEDGHRVWEQQREVTFGSAFFLGTTPVTQDQYAAVTGENPTDHEKMGDAPIDSVNWNQANEYCQKLTQLDREAGVLPDGWEYRLPTEAEWEYACRAGRSQPRHGAPRDVAWHHDNADERPHSVGQKMPNAWGFHDMLGNVWEWCQDWFVANSCRSVRGGSYFNSGRFCRCASAGAGIRTVADATAVFDCSLPRPARST